MQLTVEDKLVIRNLQYEYFVLLGNRIALDQRIQEIGKALQTKKAELDKQFRGSSADPAGPSLDLDTLEFK